MADPTGAVPPHLWMKDKDIVACCKCYRKFSLFRRRHHCRRCGKIYCHDCSTALIKFSGNIRKSRVCDHCFTEMTATGKMTRRKHAQSVDSVNMSENSMFVPPTRARNVTVIKSKSKQAMLSKKIKEILKRSETMKMSPVAPLVTADNKHEATKVSLVSLKSSGGLANNELRKEVQLPVGEDINEWLASHTVDFYNLLSLLYGTVSESCTPDTCTSMSAGPGVEYLWADDVKIKIPIQVSARAYVTYLLDWVADQLSDEAIFPQDENNKFPQDFRRRVARIFKRLFRLYAHIYHHHFDDILKANEEAHLNTCFKHFLIFAFEFNLIELVELEPLKPLVDHMIFSESEILGDESKYDDAQPALGRAVSDPTVAAVDADPPAAADVQEVPPTAAVSSDAQGT